MNSASIAQLLAGADERLQLISGSPRLDAELLLSSVLAKPRSFLYAWPEQRVQLRHREAFDALLKRRSQGEPLAYILGRREFWSLELEVSPAVLIPRPETELLVELALARIASGDGGENPQIADLGTGSGAIALAIASECPDARIVATDISPQALAVAQRNAARLALRNIEFRQGDWCRALGEDRFALIVANPPYIASSSHYLQQGDVRFEPAAALLGGGDGLHAMRALAQQAGAYLQAGGYLMLEHGYDQGSQVCALMREHGFADVADHLDYAGMARVCVGMQAPGTEGPS